MQIWTRTGIVCYYSAVPGTSLSAPYIYNVPHLGGTEVLSPVRSSGKFNARVEIFQYGGRTCSRFLFCGNYCLGRHPSWVWAPARGNSTKWNFNLTMSSLRRTTDWKRCFWRTSLIFVSWVCSNNRVVSCCCWSSRSRWFRFRFKFIRRCFLVLHSHKKPVKMNLEPFPPVC